MKNKSKVLTPRLLLSIITVLLWFSQYIHVPFQTPYLSGISVSVGFIGIIIGAYGIMQIIGRIPVGLFADLRGQRKPFIVGGMFCTFLGSLTRVLFPNGSGYLAANLLSGLASVSWICFIVMFTDMFSKKELQSATGKIISLNNLGILLGFLAGMILHDAYGMQTLCIAGTVAAFIGLVLSFFLTPETNLTGVSPSKSDISQVFRNHRVILFGLAALVQQGVAASTANSFTTRAAKEMGASGMQIGLCSIVYILSAVISSNFSNKKYKHLTPAVTMPLLFLGLAMYCFLVPNLPSVFFLYPLQILAGLGQGWLYASTTVEGMVEIPDSVHSTAMGFYASIYAIGMAVFPIFTGNIAENTGIPSAFYFLALICITSAVLIKIWYEKQNRAKRNPI